MERFLEFLHKLVRRLRSAADLMNVLAATIEALLGMFGGGPGFGFAAG
jgi:hypothetical protein